MTDRRTVLLVVGFLGAVALVLSVGDIVLVREIIHQGAGAGTVDPAAVAAVGGIGTLAAGALGALGALLVSTRSGPPEGAPDPGPLPLEPDPAEPVDVEPAAPRRR